MDSDSEYSSDDNYSYEYSNDDYYEYENDYDYSILEEIYEIDNYSHFMDVFIEISDVSNELYYFKWINCHEVYSICENLHESDNFDKEFDKIDTDVNIENNLIYYYSLLLFETGFFEIITYNLVYNFHKKLKELKDKCLYIL